MLRASADTSLPAASAGMSGDTLLDADQRIVLEVRNLAVQFATERGPVSAVEGVSLRVCHGETVALVGESGSGKSVTSLGIMGLLPANARVRSDAILLRDRRGQIRPMRGQSEREMRRLRGYEIAMVFQDPMTSLNPLERVGAQIAEAITLHEAVSRRDALDRALGLLDRVGIPEPRKRLMAYPHQLSGGMRQRVMIAIALACGPGLLIADEPTTALDATIQIQILELIRELQRESGMGVLFVTHDLDVVAAIADRVVVMYAGQVIETGAVRDVLSMPQHPYTAGLLRSVPRIDGDHQAGERLVPLPGSVPDPLRMPRGCRFHPRCTLMQDGPCNGEPVAMRHAAPNGEVRCVLTPISGIRG